MNKSKDFIILNCIAYLTVGFYAILAFLPFLMLVMSSFIPERYILNHGYTFFPKQVSMEAYKMVFSNPQKILNAYGITIFVTVVGTITSLFMSSMAAYVMFRKDVKYRNQIAFFLFFTTLFSGGLVPHYLLITKYLHLRDTLAILILTHLFSVFNILMLRNFIRGSIPDSLIESAKIDGAGDFGIYVRIIVPLSKPAFASIGLFTALAYWNDWSTTMMYINKQRLYSLQYTLYQILASVNFASDMVGSNMPSIEQPKESLKLALTVIATGPIIFLYPFLQKYFVKGITVGAVKG